LALFFIQVRQGEEKSSKGQKGFKRGTTKAAPSKKEFNPKRLGAAFPLTRGGFYAREEKLGNHKHKAISPALKRKAHPRSAFEKENRNTAAPSVISPCSCSPQTGTRRVPKGARSLSFP
jgi:hypothetical protein